MLKFEQKLPFLSCTYEGEGLLAGHRYPPSSSVFESILRDGIKFGVGIFLLHTVCLASTFNYYTTHAHSGAVRCASHLPLRESLPECGPRSGFASAGQSPKVPCGLFFSAPTCLIKRRECLGIPFRLGIRGVETEKIRVYVCYSAHDLTRGTPPAPKIQNVSFFE